MIHIRTYPFMPPSSLAGWLERLRRLSIGEDVPFRSTIPQQANEPIRWQGDNGGESEERIFLDMAHYCCLGAQPVGPFTTFTAWRQGPKTFTHGRFSALRKAMGSDIKTEQYQLHRWEYLICQQLQALVLAATADELQSVRQTAGWGLNIGKEGYAYVSIVSEPFKLERKRFRAKPSTFLSLEDARKLPRCEYYPLYFFKPKSHAAVEGYYMEMFACTPDEVELDYWLNNKHGAHIPQATVAANRYFRWWGD
jgi:hypothetical protein